MNDAASAGRSFLVLAQITSLLSDGHDRGCNWRYEIGRTTTKGGLIQSVEDMKGSEYTGGYEIHIWIEPPVANSNNPDTAQIATESAS
jgi:hypothetical protein